jgi:hypothetical protein
MQQAVPHIAEIMKCRIFEKYASLMDGGFAEPFYISID